MEPAYVGLLGTALGAGIAALLSWQKLKSEDRQWTRDARQQAYRDFLSAGTSLHRACEEVAKSTEPDKGRLLDTPTVEFDEAYVTLQINADRPVFLAAKDYNYWFPDLTRVALKGSAAEVNEIGREMRRARHSFLAAVRRELGLPVDKELLPGLR